MARTTGPLFSFDASGTIAGAVVFSKWRGRNYVRRHAIPSNPRLPLQVSVRTMMGFLSRYWQELSAPDQATWDDPAKARNILPFNSYCAANLTSWTHAEYPSQVYPRSPVSTPPGQATVSGTGGLGLLTFLVTAGSPAATWGYALHMSLTPGFTSSRATLVGILVFDASPLTLVVAPVAPGDWYVSGVSFNVDGVSEAGGVAGPVTVT